MVLGSKVDPLLKNWHRCRKWTDKKMPCPMEHEGDQEPERTPKGGPTDWIREWYLRDINISRRTGWKGEKHDQFVEWVNKLTGEIFAPEKHPHMDAGTRFRSILQEFNRTGGVYPPSDAKGDSGGPQMRLGERPYEAFWPPVKDRSLPGLYQPKDPIGSGGDQRPYRMYWEESAFTEVAGEVMEYGNPMPGGTPSGIPRSPGFGAPLGAPMLFDTWEKMKGLLGGGGEGPALSGGGIPAFKHTREGL